MMQNDRVIFDEENHRYFRGGGELPSVTSIIKGAGLSPDYSMIKGASSAAEYGKRVHKTIEIYLTKREEVYEDIFIQNALNRFKKFEEEFFYVPIECEKIVSGSDYAGTVDLIGEIGKRFKKKVIVDIKTGSPANWHVVQLSAYRAAYKRETGLELDCYALYISSDGYKVKPFAVHELIAGYAVFCEAKKTYKNEVHK
jgi:CRISPR/Cas system-associated exonuclease Cas4 (RecB family)